jgi:gliding motility-associated-like protein
MQACDDGNPFTINDLETILDCDGSVCIPCLGEPVDCTTGTTTVQACDDGDACTTNDEETILDSDGTVCIPCAGTPLPCGTNGACEQVLACDDGDPCTENDVETILLSDGTVCVPCAGTSIDCTTGTTSVVSCDDGDPCTINDVQTVLDCDGSVCVPCMGIVQDCATGATTTQPCDDGDPNTFNDEQTILDCDGSICIPCMGIACNLDLDPAVTVIGESCAGALDGLISIDTITGGQEPYLFSLNGGAFSASTQFGNLSPGSYSITIQDAEGCEVVLGLTVNAAEVLWLNFTSATEVQLGDSLQLSFMTNAAVDSIIWTFDPDLSCLNCPEPFVSPEQRRVYEVTVIDENGCIISGQTTITVDRTERIYIPNIFSPNGDGVNDEFVVYTGEGVNLIRSFRIYERWGGMIFEEKDIPANDSEFSWNGMYRDQPASPGVYLYQLEIELADGRIVTRSGEVVLLR